MNNNIVTYPDKNTKLNTQQKRPFIARYRDFWANVQAMIFYPFQRLGPFAVALMPALFTGHSVYTWYASNNGWWLAVTISVVVAVAMEAVNINVVHTSLDLFENGQKGKGVLMAFFSVVVMALVSSVIGLSENGLSPLIKSLAVASPWLTGIVYLAVGMAQSIHYERQQTELARDDERQQRAMDRELERQIRLQELENKQQIALAKIDAKKDAKNTHAPANAGDSAFLPGDLHALAQANDAKKTQIETRRIEVLRLSQDGQTTSEIAQVLGCSPDTIRRDMKALNGKLTHNGSVK